MSFILFASTRAFGALATLFISYLVTNIYNQQESGVLLLFINAITFFGTIAIYGSNQYLVKSYSIYKNSSKLFSAIFLSFLVTLIIFLFSFYYISENYGDLVLIYVLLASFLFSLNQLVSHTFNGIGYVNVGVIFQSCLSPAIFIIITLFLWDDFSSNKYYFFNYFVLSLFITFITGILILFKINSFDTSFDFREHAVEARYFFYISLLTVIYQQGPLLFSSYFLTEEDYAVFSVCSRIVLSIGFILIVLNSLYARKLAQKFNDKSFAEVAVLFKKIFTYTLFFVLFIFLFIVFFASSILSFFGDDYSNFNIPLILMAVGQSIAILLGVYYLLLSMCNQESLYFRSLLLVLPFSLLTLYFLVTKFGLFGASLAFTLNALLPGIVCLIKSKLQRGCFLI